MFVDYCGYHDYDHDKCPIPMIIVNHCYWGRQGARDVVCHSEQNGTIYILILVSESLRLLNNR